MSEVDSKQDFNKIEELANNGDIKALFKLGNCFFKGWGVEQDFAKAAELHLKAIESGFNEVSFEKDDQPFTPTLEQLVEVYKAASEWRIRYDFYHSYKCYAGCGDDYSYGDIINYHVFSPRHDLVKKVLLDSDNKFCGISIAGSAHDGMLYPTLFTDGTIKGLNSIDDMCPRMDGPEDWHYRDKYTLIKSEDK